MGGQNIPVLEVKGVLTAKYSSSKDVIWQLIDPMLIYGTRFQRNPLGRLIDFYGISTILKLFYALRLGNCVRCMFTFTFYVQVLKMFSIWLCGINHSSLIQIICKQIDMAPKDGTLTGNTIPFQSGLGSNGNEGYSTLSTTGASSSDAVYIMPGIPECSYLTAGDEVRIF